MAITIKTPEEIEILREGGKRHAFILNEVAKRVVPGVSTKELDDLAESLVIEGGDKSAFLGYKPAGAKRPFPASLCISINDEVVHGIPNEIEKILKEGDVVALDMGLIHKGMITDMAVTVPVGKIDADSKKLLSVTKKSLDLAIKACKGNGTVGDVGHAVESFVLSQGLTIIAELAGHGVGYKVHEDPFVPNYGDKGEGDKLVPGMVIAIEPIVSLGIDKIKLDSDGYTYRTADKKRSAHFEHTVVVTQNGCEILTK
jgi:methionyl aminopeptidase